MVTSGFGGLGGQHPNQGRGVLGQVAGLERQTAGFRSVTGGDGEEAARQGLDPLLAAALGAGGSGTAGGLDHPDQTPPQDRRQKRRKQGQQGGGSGGHLDPPAHPVEIGTAGLAGQGHGRDRGGGDQEQDEGGADHEGAREARARPARASARRAAT